jgi:hypothetical protein
MKTFLGLQLIFGNVGEYFNCHGAQYRQAWMECQARRGIHTNKNGSIERWSQVTLVAYIMLRLKARAHGNANCQMSNIKIQTPNEGLHPFMDSSSTRSPLAGG